MEEADLLLDRPPGGWTELVTKDWLRLELSVMESRFDVVDSKFDAVNVRFDAVDQRFDSLEARMGSFEARMGSFEARMGSFERELRAQTWKITAAVAGLLGVFIAAIKL